MTRASPGRSITSALIHFLSSLHDPASRSRKPSQYRLSRIQRLVHGVQCQAKRFQAPQEPAARYGSGKLNWQVGETFQSQHALPLQQDSGQDLDFVDLLTKIRSG